MGGNGSEMLIYSCANGVVASAPGVGISLNANQDFLVCGPGAVFWMWCSALLGMCTKFAEVTLAVRFRETNARGERVGGPMYYIKNGLSRRWLPLAYLYAQFGVMAVFGTGNATCFDDKRWFRDTRS